MTPMTARPMTTAGSQRLRLLRSTRCPSIKPSSSLRTAAWRATSRASSNILVADLRVPTVARLCGR